MEFKKESDILHLGTEDTRTGTLGYIDARVDKFQNNSNGEI